MGVPLNHPFIVGFSIINHLFWGIPMYGKPHISMETTIFCCRTSCTKPMLRPRWAAVTDPSRIASATARSSSGGYRRMTRVSTGRRRWQSLKTAAGWSRLELFGVFSVFHRGFLRNQRIWEIRIRVGFCLGSMGVLRSQRIREDIFLGFLLGDGGLEDQTTRKCKRGR